MPNIVIRVASNNKHRQPHCAGWFFFVGESKRPYKNCTDFVVTLGVYQFGIEPPIETVTATIMHELGQNLGLHHGGDDFLSQKPNYVSVMNYLYSIAGVPTSSVPGSLDITGRRVDYSDETLPDLDESDLDEVTGVASAHANDLIAFFVHQPAFGVSVGATNRAIGWNNDGDAIDTHVAADITGEGSLTRLSGFNDWAYIRDKLRTTR